MLHVYLMAKDEILISWRRLLAGDLCGELSITARSRSRLIRTSAAVFTAVACDGLHRHRSAARRLARGNPPIEFVFMHAYNITTRQRDIFVRWTRLDVGKDFETCLEGSIPSEENRI